MVSISTGRTLEPPTFIDRVLGATLGLFGMVITILFAPMILWFSLSDSAAFRWNFYIHGSWAYWCLLWALWVPLVGAIAGFCSGFWRMLQFMSHFWFTADEPNPTLSLILWCGLIALGALTYQLLLRM